MKDPKKAKQRMLQVSFGGGLIVLVVLIEMLAVHPSGIYSYSQNGYKEFTIGLSKETVLKRINLRKSIRMIKSCDPDMIFELTSRKRFDFGNALASSNYWIAHDRTGKDFLFLFKEKILDRVLIQRLRGGEKNTPSPLFVNCDPDILKDVDTYLNSKETLTIYTNRD